MLEPVLFNIYVNDMLLHVNSVLLQFADDVKMFRSVNLKRENRDRKKVLKQGEDSGNF